MKGALRHLKITGNEGIGWQKAYNRAFLALLLTLSCTGALAVRNPYIGVMRVVNCDEWASLRLEPYEYTERLAKVPLGALVYAYYEDKEFTRCYYDGYGWGYIKNEYLALRSSTSHGIWQR